MAEKPSASWMKESASKVERTGPESDLSLPSSACTVVSRSSARSVATKEDRSIRELNKRLRGIYERDEEKDYGDDVKGDELYRRFKVGCSLAKKGIENIMKEIDRARVVDLCFLVDCTGSMQPYIDEARNAIKKIVDKSIGAKGPANSLRCAFVGYRDFGDANQFEILEFTSNVGQFKSFCHGIVAKGGGMEANGAEDVFGGLQNATCLNWNEQAGTRIIFHIADAPCHGQEFHEKCVPDYYWTGDPNHRSAADLFAQLRHQCIHYYFGKIKESTNLMIEKFSREYGEPIVTFDLKDVSLLDTAVITSVTTSIMKAVEDSKAGTKGKKLRTYTIDPIEPKWSSVRVENGSYLSYMLPTSVEELLQPTHYLERKLTKNVRVKIAPNPFGQGAERVAYFGRGLSHPKEKLEKSKTASFDDYDKLLKKDRDEDGVKIVLKEYKHVGKGMNTHDRYELANQIQTVATFFALRFNKLYPIKLLPIKMKFLKVKTLCVPLSTGKSRYMTCEKLMVKSTIFIRFTNNVDYKIIQEKALAVGVSQDHIDLLMAFTHWTYEETKTEMMIVDLQGVLCKDEKTKKDMLLLTDPAIHCKDVTRFRPLNLGKNGMDAFLKNHTCNAICRNLELSATRS